MTRVLAVTATEVEAARLARHLGLARRGRTPWPHYRDGHLEVLCAGVGARRLAERAAGCAAALVVSAGVCGALAPHLEPGAVVVPEAVIGPGGSRHATDALPGLARSGTLLTVPAVVETPAAKARLWMETGALAVDMESAAVIEWARARGLPVAVIRGVSDAAAQAVPADLAALVEPAGRVSAGRALRTILARPRAIAGALALRRGADRALRAVAATLAALSRSR